MWDVISCRSPERRSDFRGFTVAPSKLQDLAQDQLVFLLTVVRKIVM